MRTYAIKRLLLMIPNLLGITLVTFCLIRLAPGDPAAQIKGGAAAGQQAGRAPTKDVVEKWRKERGLDRPLLVQYGLWLKNLSRLNFGTDFAQSKPVLPKVWEHAQATLWLNVASILVIYVVAIPIGIYSAARQYSFLDRSLTLLLFILYSLPSFWVATLALNLVCGDSEMRWPRLFAVLGLTLPLGVYLAVGAPGMGRKLFAVLGVGAAVPAAACFAMMTMLYCGQKVDDPHLGFWDTKIRFPVVASETHDEALYTTRYVDRTVETNGRREVVQDRVQDLKVPLVLLLGHRAWHMFLPLVCLTYAGFAFISRQMRAGMLENIRQDYVRTARAKGLSETKVVLKHALRNSLIPIVTLLGTLLPSLLGGSIIMERIFSLHGIGWLDLEAIFTREYNVIMGVTTLVAILTLIGIMISDMVYVLVNPRISLE